MIQRFVDFERSGLDLWIYEQFSLDSDSNGTDHGECDFVGPISRLIALGKWYLLSSPCSLPSLSPPDDERHSNANEI